MLFCFFKQKTAYEMRISDWSSDVCSSDLQSKCKGAIDKNLSEFRSRRRLCVQMQWLRIMSHRREEKIVCFGDGATDGMGDGVANSPLVEISAAHDAASRTTRARSIPSVTCAPSTTFSSATIPLKGATRLCSIFMASSVTSFWPFVTHSPSATATEISLPGIGEMIAPSRAAPPPEPRGGAKVKENSSPHRPPSTNTPPLSHHTT